MRKNISPFFMSNSVKIFLGFVLLSLFISCSKSEDATPKDAESIDFLEIVISGKTYKNDIYSGGTGLANQQGCLAGKPHFLGLLSQVETSTFFFGSNISYLENEVDFTKFNAGKYSVETWTGNNSICNLNLAISLEDKSLTNKKTTLNSGGINTITSIKKGKVTSTSVLYQIQGNFTCSFKNNSGTTIPITGKYQITVPVNR
jgi:hypothetical protein